MTSNNKPYRRRTAFYAFARRLFSILSPLFFPVKYHNPDNIKQPDAPFMLVSNHTSMLDPPVIGYACRRYEIRFIGKKELEKNQIARYFLRKIHMIAVARNASDIVAFRASSSVLKSGHVLGVFPEGTRRKPGELMQDLETGLPLLALRHHVPLVPVYIHGRIRAFRLTHVYVGTPLSPEMLSQSGSSARDHNSFLAQSILHMKEEATVP